MSKPKSKVSLVKVFKTIVWPRRNIIALGLVLIFIRSAAGLVPPWITKPFVDNILVKGEMQKLPEIILWLGLAILIQSITSYLLTKLLSVEAQHLISVLRSQV